MLAELHRTETSSGRRFGFGNPTYHGNVPVEHGWSDTWEDYFIRTTRELLQLEQQAQGPNQELLELTEPFLEKVVPRLLRPLETGGRSIKACLIHSDLWHGNTGTDRKTGLPIIFDAASFYAHNECMIVETLRYFQYPLTLFKMILGSGERHGTISESHMSRLTTSISLSRTLEKITMIVMHFMSRMFTP